MILAYVGEPSGQGWFQVAELAVALVLSALIGLEREVRQKSAGLRTHTLVGFASALIVLVSKYGFTDVLGEHVTLDPSRVAAQIVSGIGFIGGGLIFVRRDAVRGLTTAAVVWLTAAVGMAAGAGLLLLAVLVTAGHFLVVFGFTPLVAHLPRSKYSATWLLIRYVNGRGALRDALAECTRRNFTVSNLSVEQREDRQGIATVRVLIRGGGPVTDLTTALSEVERMVSVSSDEEVAARM
jgi:putative Mg2+ transporter-C (MgtC) family protein